MHLSRGILSIRICMKTKKNHTIIGGELTGEEEEIEASFQNIEGEGVVDL